MPGPAKVLALGWAQSSGDIARMPVYWQLFTAIDLLGGFISFAIERRESWYPPWLLIPQRLGYRLIMEYVVEKALALAPRGPRAGRGKLARSRRVAGI